ncbi:MAG TPA: TIM barrel protein [Steroidobacteraceae bacterium]|jgi:sugar phosphate isomerase/epimerase|nr:TIM barrel protein [Steroidobacteraceae bacterium]
MHPRISVNTLCFPGASVGDMAGHWRELGVRRVSLVSNLLLEEGVPAAQEALRTGDYQVETISHAFMFGRHLELREESWREARDTLARVIEAAKIIGARSIYMVTGGHGSLLWEEAAQAFRAAIAPCIAQASAAGIPLAIEDASALYAHANLAHTLRDTVVLAEMADVGVCIDFFACWTEAGLQQSIERAAPRCRIVQVCDYVYGDRSLPARAVPGDGNIPIKRMLDWILKAGYTGAFDLELIGPRIDREGHLLAVRRAAENLGAMLQSLGA